MVDYEKICADCFLYRDLCLCYEINVFCFVAFLLYVEAYYWLFRKFIFDKKENFGNDFSFSDLFGNDIIADGWIVFDCTFCAQVSSGDTLLV